MKLRSTVAEEEVWEEGGGDARSPHVLRLMVMLSIIYGIIFSSSSWLVGTKCVWCPHSEAEVNNWKVELPELVPLFQSWSQT